MLKIMSLMLKLLSCESMPKNEYRSKSIELLEMLDERIKFLKEKHPEESDIIECYERIRYKFTKLAAIELKIRT